MKRGTMSKIAESSGVPYETVRRYFAGGNVGINTVDKIRKAEDACSKKADGKQKKSRKSSDAAVAKAGA